MNVFPSCKTTQLHLSVPNDALLTLTNVNPNLGRPAFDLGHRNQRLRNADAAETAAFGVAQSAVVRPEPP